jgi:hypothetical protein
MFDWFKKPKPQVIEKIIYKVVEVKTPRMSGPWTKDTKAAVATLPSHPGFVALQERVDLQRQMLMHKCSTEFHKDLRESDYLQAGVFWLGYLQRLLDEATQMPRRVEVDAYEEEMEAFRKLDAQLERIGMDQTPQESEQ